jgi:hypothetical protein
MRIKGFHVTIIRTLCRQVGVAFNIIMLNVIMPSVVMVSVVAPLKLFFLLFKMTMATEKAKIPNYKL